MAARGVSTTGIWQQAGQGGVSAAGVWARVRRAFQANATRHLLTEMDDRMLADIGVSRSDAMMEANRAPWDIEPRRR